MVDTNLTDAEYRYFNDKNAGVNSGYGGLATAQVSVGTTATLLAAARVGRGSIMLTNLGTVDTWIGGSGVTTTTGVLLVGTKGATLTIPTSAAVYGIVATGTNSISVSEVF